MAPTTRLACLAVGPRCRTGNRAMGNHCAIDLRRYLLPDRRPAALTARAAGTRVMDADRRAGDALRRSGNTALPSPARPAALRDTAHDLLRHRSDRCSVVWPAPRGSRAHQRLGGHVLGQRHPGDRPAVLSRAVQRRRPPRERARGASRRASSSTSRRISMSAKRCRSCSTRRCVSSSSASARSNSRCTA